jgi:hypothetical protein
MNAYYKYFFNKEKRASLPQSSSSVPTFFGLENALKQTLFQLHLSSCFQELS